MNKITKIGLGLGSVGAAIMLAFGTYNVVMDHKFNDEYGNIKYVIENIEYNERLASDFSSAAKFMGSYRLEFDDSVTIDNSADYERANHFLDQVPYDVRWQEGYNSSHSEVADNAETLKTMLSNYEQENKNLSQEQKNENGNKIMRIQDKTQKIADEFFNEARTLEETLEKFENNQKMSIGFVIGGIMITSYGIGMNVGAYAGNKRREEQK